MQNISILPHQLYVPDYSFFLNSSLAAHATTPISRNELRLKFLITYITNSALKRSINLNPSLWKQSFTYTPHSYLFMLREPTYLNSQKNILGGLPNPLTKDLNLFKYENLNLFYTQSSICDGLPLYPYPITSLGQRTTDVNYMSPRNNTGAYFSLLKPSLSLITAYRSLLNALVYHGILNQKTRLKPNSVTEPPTTTSTTNARHA